MTRQVIIAQDMTVPPDRLVGPVVFLAGPIMGASDWQAKATRRLAKLAPDLHVASPRAASFDGDYEAQVDWETAWLERAAHDGVILFWLARETHHRCDRAYAQTTRYELADWAARSTFRAVRIVVGIERGFTGERYIRRRLANEHRNIPVCRNLSQTCKAAVELVYGQGVQWRTLLDVLAPPD